MYGPKEPPHPHHIVIDLNATYTIAGFTALSRNDGNSNGAIKDYEFYVSQDGKQWGDPVAKGTFEQNDSLKKVSFYDDQSIYSEERKSKDVTFAL